ncbi:MAG: iron chelate uptake ABC transporter family permease subunit [Candidatus Sericytochromatia bacterium]|uniref:Iron chelate uptake ABC transporter family permease subunit n=1 Tax=Candidatus Tanganyikabacteria bacterium TaxID=2961651 RepID=A0A938BNY8_9BACT|nr:iron chelate uptake ABC transporter family permease subunit [Candidatus Tanganyikabacteria bacterium]
MNLITGRPADPTVQTIVLDLRLPRILLAIGAGAGLAAAGVAWQGVLRNPLADPYLIGVSAGGALGAGIAMAFELRGPGGTSLVPSMAFAGSLGAIALVYIIGGGTGRLRLERLLLAGVALTSFLSAILTVLLTLKAEKIPPMHFWLMGSVAPPRGWPDLFRELPYLGIGLLALFALSGPLNVLQLGTDRARSLGVNPKRTEFILIGAASLVTAAVVSTCGMIGFVGLVVPHLARLLVGSDLRLALPTAALAGASLLVLADLVARLCGEIPVGVVTAFLGAPFFLALLLKETAR